MPFNGNGHFAVDTALFCSYNVSGDRFLYKEVFTMKTTGMIRQLDALGRIVLPIELRRNLDINTQGFPAYPVY